MAFKGIDVRQTGDRLIFRAFLQDSDGALVTSGTTTLKLYELQDDGTLKSYDFDDNTFKTTALTTETAAMTHQQGNNGATDTGLWTCALTTLAGFTAGNIYFAMVTNAGAGPTDQLREFQFGSAQGDLVVADGAVHAALSADQRNEIADALLRRDMDQVEATAPEHSLCTVVLATLESSVSGTTWTIKRTDGTTTHVTKTVATQPNADPITGVS